MREEGALQAAKHAAVTHRMGDVPHAVAALHGVGAVAVVAVVAVLVCRQVGRFRGMAGSQGRQVDGHRVKAAPACFERRWAARRHTGTPAWRCPPHRRRARGARPRCRGARARAASGSCGAGRSERCRSGSRSAAVGGGASHMFVSGGCVSGHRLQWGASSEGGADRRQRRPPSRAHAAPAAAPLLAHLLQGLAVALGDLVGALPVVPGGCCRRD